MKTKLLMISGKKLAGKDTVSDFIRRNNTELFECGTDKSVVKYGFADELKKTASDLFEFPFEWTQTQEGKETFVPHILWENLPHYMMIPDDLKPRPWGPMKVREILQEYGTGVMRRIHSPIWINKTLRTIKQEKPFLAIMNDVRYPNEIELVTNHSDLEVKSLRLTRNINDMSLAVNQHSSETALDGYDKFDAIVDNQHLSISQTNLEVINLLVSWGWSNRKMNNKVS